MQMKLRGLPPQNIGPSPRTRSFFIAFKSISCTGCSLFTASQCTMENGDSLFSTLTPFYFLFSHFTNRKAAQICLHGLLAFGTVCSRAYGNRQRQETRRCSVPQFIDRRFRTRYTEKNKTDRPLALKSFLPKADRLKRRYSCENLYAGAFGCRWRPY